MWCKKNIFDNLNYSTTEICNCISAVFSQQNKLKSGMCVRTKNSVSFSTSNHLLLSLVDLFTSFHFHFLECSTFPSPKSPISTPLVTL